MQWDRVKNILIGILLAVNLFLLCSLGAKFWQNWQRADELEANLRALTENYGVSLTEAFELPQDKVLPTLSLDRSRADEEAVAQRMLGEDADRTEREDGTVRFESEAGYAEWRADGTVRAACVSTEGVPEDEAAALRQARRLFSSWGLLTNDDALRANGMSVTLTGTVAGQPVHNRALTLRFDSEGGVSLSGLWSFGTPYTTVRGSGVSCNAADALLEFAAQAADGMQIRSMTAGYRMELDGSRRLQLTPTWKIVTDSGEYLVDCAKKTVIGREN